MGAEGARIARVGGRALVLAIDDVDTDRIIAARFLKAITFDGLEAHVFQDDRQEAVAAGATHPFDDAKRMGASVLVTGANFGCGSSREHAPRAIAQWGIRAIVAESFAEIFASNALTIGLPCVTMARADLDRLSRAVGADSTLDVAVDLQAMRVRFGDDDAPVAMPESARAALVSGDWDATSLLLDRYDEVEAVAARLPYRFD